MTRPRRLSGFSYVGRAQYFLTFCTNSRLIAFDTARSVSEAWQQFQLAAADERFAMLAYCFMPDHVHLLVEGTNETSDLRKFAKMAKQRAGTAYTRRTGRKLWQEGYYEHVLRGDENVVAVARYILANPVRAGLAESIESYPFSGSERWTMSELTDAVQIVGVG
jgi:putative transposase